MCWVLDSSIADIVYSWDRVRQIEYSSISLIHPKFWWGFGIHQVTILPCWHMAKFSSLNNKAPLYFTQLHIFSYIPDSYQGIFPQLLVKKFFFKVCCLRRLWAHQKGLPISISSDSLPSSKEGFSRRPLTFRGIFLENVRGYSRPAVNLKSPGTYKEHNVSFFGF